MAAQTITLLFETEAQIDRAAQFVAELVRQNVNLTIEDQDRHPPITRTERILVICCTGY